MNEGIKVLELHMHSINQFNRLYSEYSLLTVDSEYC